MNAEVAVIVPVYNTGDYLRDAVLSLLAQRPVQGRDDSLPAFEIVVVDDASTDTITLSLLSALPGLDRRIRVIRNNRSKGAAGARNTGIASTHANWITFLDADDILLPHALAVRWQAHLNFTEARWIASRFKVLQPSQQPTSNAPFPSLATLLEGHPLTAGHLPPVTAMVKPLAEFAKSCFTGIMTVLIERQLVLDKGGFDETLLRAEDYKLWINCSLDQTLFFCDFVIAYYRIHPKSLTHGDSSKFQMEEQMLDSLLKLPLSRHQKHILRDRFDVVFLERCYFYRSKHRFFKAAHAAICWILRRPFRPDAYKQFVAAAARVS